MLEQAETCTPSDLKTELHMSQEIFEVWFNSSPRVCPNGSDATASPADCTCASVIRHYAIDQQGVDFRGSVSAGTAWDLCCRLLSLTPSQNKLSTRDLAQLLVYWLDDGQVPPQMREALYKGMREYSLQKNERAETEADEQRFRSRWLRWRIHGTEHLFWILPSCSEDQWILCLHALCTGGTRFCPHTIQAR